MKKLLLFLVILIIVSAVVHGIWEYGQCGVFYTFNGITSFENYDLLFGRVILDITATITIFLIISIINLDWKWIVTWDAKDTFLIIFLSLLGSFYVEASSLHIGRWGYSSSMPLLTGTEIGLTPLLQWMVLIPLSILIARLFIKGRINKIKRYRF